MNTAEQSVFQNMHNHSELHSQCSHLLKMVNLPLQSSTPSLTNAHCVVLRQQAESSPNWGKQISFIHKTGNTWITSLSRDQHDDAQLPTRRASQRHLLTQMQSFSLSHFRRSWDFNARHARQHRLFNQLSTWYMLQFVAWRISPPNHLVPRPFHRQSTLIPPLYPRAQSQIVPTLMQLRQCLLWAY